MLTFKEYVASLFRGTRITSISDVGSRDTVQVSSTCLREVRYDLNTRTLGVTFRESGATYNYFGVAESDYEAVVDALSVGGEYNNTIKGTYPYSRT